MVVELIVTRLPSLIQKCRVGTLFVPTNQPENGGHKNHAHPTIRLLLVIVFTLLPGMLMADYPSLWQSQDQQLQQQLNSIVKQRNLHREVNRGNLALVVVDISDPLHPKVANVNGDKMIYAASLPKIAILLGAFVQIENGKLAADPSLWVDMTLMIRNSSNQAATRVLERVGREELLQILQSPKFKLYDTSHNGGLWVGKDYARDGAYKRDPLKNLSHAATVMQVARFYYLLDTDRIVGPKLTRQMKQIMSDPAIAHKFVKGLKSVPEVVMYRKSGTWKNYHADSALVEFGTHKYIIVGLAQSKQGGKWLEQLALPLHQLIVGK